MGKKHDSFGKDNRRRKYKMGPDVEYLRKYHKTTEVIQDGFENISGIPEIWVTILKQKTPDKIRSIIDMWEKDFSHELPQQIAYFEKHLKDVDLITYVNFKKRQVYSLLYSIESEKGRILYYEGGNPLDVKQDEKIMAHLSRFPEKITQFYETLHNGFFYYASGSTGLISACDIWALDDEEWHILEELEEPLQIDMENTYAVFASGGGGYVVVDLGNCENNNATIWSTTRQPNYNQNFWGIVDTWTVIGLEG